MSSFFCFQRAMREEVKKANPGVQNKVIVQKLSEKWRELDAKGKEPYDKLAEIEHQKYLANKKIYDDKKKAEAEAEKEKEKALKAKSKEEKPKEEKAKEETPKPTQEKPVEVKKVEA